MLSSTIPRKQPSTFGSSKFSASTTLIHFLIGHQLSVTLWFLM
jgi:hypothetical protein